MAGEALRIMRRIASWRLTWLALGRRFAVMDKTVHRWAAEAINGLAEAPHADTTPIPQSQTDRREP